MKNNTDNTFVESQRILYTPSTFAKNNLSFLQETGTLKAIKTHISQRTNLNSYLFFIVLDGRGSLYYQGKTYSLKTNDCVFIDCNNLYWHATDSQYFWTLQWAHFYGSEIHSIYRLFAEQGRGPLFHMEDPAYIIELLDKLYQLGAANNIMNDLFINSTLASLMATIIEKTFHPLSHHNVHTRDYMASPIEEIKGYLDDNWAKKIALDELADQFYINKFYLTRVFKKQYGLSITNYISNLRITNAKQRLRFTNDNIEKIGIDCGYDDANYFSRVFKKIEGISPAEYRRKWVQ